MKARIWYNLALRIARESIAVLVGAVTLTAAAYLPPVAERDGVAVRIAGFDETTGSPGLHVVTRNSDEPMSIQIVLENRRAEAVSGQVKAWLNDDWEVDEDDVAVLVSVVMGGNKNKLADADLNHDKKVDAADVVTLVKMIMSQK